MANQDFLFSRAKKAARNWHDFEVEVIKALTKSLDIDAKNVTEYKRLARKNKKQFLKEVKELSIKNKSIFSKNMEFEINKMLNEGIGLTDGEVNNIVDKAKTWKPNNVVSRDEFLNDNHKTINRYVKKINKDADIALSGLMKQLSNKYSQFINEISYNLSKLNEGEEFVSALRKNTIKSLNLIADKGLPTIVNKAGQTLDIVNYMEMATRANFKSNFNELQDKRYKDYGINLVVSNVLSDSSNICEPYQGNVYSNGEDKTGRYTDKSVPEGQGLTTHINCRHFWMPYVHNITTKPEPVDAKTVKRNRLNRQAQRYNERQIRRWKRRYKVDGSEFNSNKISEWQGRQRELIKSNPGMSRDYSREQILELQ